MKTRLLYILLLLPLLLGSCVTAKKVNYMQSPDGKIPAYQDTLTYEEYRLHSGDRLYVYIYALDERISQMFNAGQSSSTIRQQMQNGSVNGSYDLYTYLIDDEGMINFPTIGRMPVRGMTTREVKLALEQELAQSMHEIPGFSSISAEVSIVQRTFSVVGPTRSGRYPILKEKLTIFEALGLIGNLDDFSDRSRVKLIRELDGQTVVKEFDLRSEDIINSEFYYIEPNDIIYIRKITGQAFGMNSAATAVSTVAATISFGVFIYTIVQTGINHVKKYKKGGAQ